MAKNNILPLIAVAGGMFLLMRSGGGSIEKGLDHAEETAEGLARKVTHTLVHGDLLEGIYGHSFRPKDPGDTVRITGAPANWSYYSFDDPEGEQLDIYHDKGNQALYVTSLLPDSGFYSASESGLAMGVRVHGIPPGVAENDHQNHEELVYVSGTAT